MPNLNIIQPTLWEIGVQSFSFILLHSSPSEAKADDDSMITRSKKIAHWVNTKSSNKKRLCILNAYLSMFH